MRIRIKLRNCHRIKRSMTCTVMDLLISREVTSIRIRVIGWRSNRKIPEEKVSAGVNHTYKQGM